MQGKLSEIDIRSILQLVELGQRTGELFVEAYPTPLSFSNSEAWEPEHRSSALTANMPRQSEQDQQTPGSQKSWFVFFTHGQIVYAADATTQQLTRLKDFAYRYGIETALNRLPSTVVSPFHAPEYGHLWALLENHTLTPEQGRTILQGMISETLFDLLSLHHGSFVFETGAPLSPQLNALEISPLLARVMKQGQLWIQLRPYIRSPDQCPIIVNLDILQEQLSDRTLSKFSRFADGQTSLRQIARYLNRDIYTVGKAIHPYVRQGVIQFNQPEKIRSLIQPLRVDGLPQPPREQSQSDQPEPLISTPKIVCIDDGASVRETVLAILRPHGYQVAAIANPLEAFSLIFQFQPHLILCDIAMPQLDGYEVCAMLRQSTAFRQTPIIMLTGKDGFIDRVRARIVGATDYLTKPFGEHELLTLVEKYSSLGYAKAFRSTKVLADELESNPKISRTDATSRSSAPLN
jgi:twitching motility two-component system response regulator PilG